MTVESIHSILSFLYRRVTQRKAETFSFTPETDESDSAIGVNWVSSCSDLDPYLMRVNSGTYTEAEPS